MSDVCVCVCVSVYGKHVAKIPLNMLNVQHSFAMFRIDEMKPLCSVVLLCTVSSGLMECGALSCVLLRSRE